jgi:arsenate reductase
MGKLKAYLYSNCGTCRKAKKYFDDHQIDFEEIAIREQPPSLSELRQMLDAYQGEVRKLFNTSGQDYRQGGYKDKLNQLTSEQALAALAENGNLIKRPFVISGSVALVGFNAEQWDRYLSA